MVDESLGDPSTQAQADAALGAYGLSPALLSPLTGGTINRAWRIESAVGPLVLKRYEFRSPEQVRRSIEVQVLAGEGGVPVPSIHRNREGDLVTLVGKKPFVLSQFVEGRVYAPDAMSPAVARRMGEMLARLHGSLDAMAPGVIQPYRERRDIEGMLRLLLAMAESRDANPVDERAAQNLRAKLALFSSLDTEPPITGQWSHGDYGWRNVLFDDRDYVAAVIDFDDARYVHAGHEVMRCIAQSFPSLGPEVDDFFAGYASARGLTPEAARGFVGYYRYAASANVWPMSVRYLDPKSYDLRWDDLIRPFLTWDWGLLSERLADLALSATPA